MRENKHFCTFEPFPFSDVSLQKFSSITNLEIFLRANQRGSIFPMEVTNIGNKFGEEILNQQADSIEENHSRAQSSEIHEEIDALERLTIDSIEALCQPKSIDFTSWISKGSDVTIDTRSRREIPQERLLIHLEQFVVYCARQGWINELHFAFAALPCETSISLCLGVLRELPANISPTLYKHLLPTVSVVSCRGTGTNKSLVFQNLEHKDLSVSVKRALEGEWNNNDASGPGSIKVLADIHNSLSPLQLCSHTMLQKHLVQWYMQKAFEIDAVGYSYHAYQLLAVAVESAEGGADGAIEEKQDHQAVVLAVLVELHLQLYQFCRHLYDSVISADTLFIDWLAASLHDKLVWLISAEGNQENASRTFAEVLMNYLIPTLEGEYSLLQSTTLQQFIVNLSELHAFDCCAASAAVKVNTLVLHAQKGTTASVLAAGVVASADPHHSRASHIDWQQQLAVALAHTVAPFDLAALERVASVVAASKPTLSRAQRCIRSDAALVELVVRTCFSYDDVHSGLEVMWQLIECTPAERLRDQHALLSDELDALQLALNTCELLKPYIPVPALSVLVPLPAFIGADGSHYRSKADNKMLRFRYKQQLLIGASFLYSRVMTVLGGGPVLSQKRKLASSSSEESLDRKINFGEAVVMKVCYEFGEKMTHATKEGRMSYLVAHTWVQLTEDLFDVCNVSVFKEDLSLHWVGVLLLTCLQHFRASEFKAVVKYLFTTAPSVVAAHGPPAHNTKKDLGFVLLNKFELSPILVQRFLLNQSRELVNSLSSCWDEESLAEVKSARDLLKMIPDEYASSETFAEFALHDLLHTLSAIKLDFIPLQLRLLSPVDIARRILFERPDAYYTIIHKDESSTAKSGVSNGSSGGDSGYSDVGCEEDPDSPWSPVVRSVAAKKAALKVQDIAGMKFVQTLLTIYSVANLVADDSDGDDAEADDWKYAESILLLLVNAALVVGDLERAFVYCNYLLDEDRFNTSSSALQDEIISSVTLVMEALTNEEEQRIERALGKALREDLLCSIVRSASIEQFDRLRHLWRSTEPVVVHKNGSFVPQSTGAEPSTALDNAKVLLYDFVASTLQQVHHSSTPAEKYRGVLSKSAIVLALQEALGYLVQMEDSRQAIALLDGISKDLQKKLVKAVELQNRSRKMGTSMAAPDENVIQQLMNKGFSRNGAKRAVLNTRNAGVNVALAWAIEHSLDEDFEHPIAQQVRGALLSEEVASGAQSAAFAVDDIQETFDFIQAVAAAYRFRVGLPPVAPLSSASIIREERAQIVRVHGAASTLSEQPASLDSSAAPSPLVSSLFGHHGPSRTQAAGKITKKVSKASLGARRIVEPTSAQATPTTVDSSKFFDDVEDSSIPPSREVQSAGAVVLDAPSTSHKALPVEPVASDAPSVANDHYNSSAVGLDGPSSKGLGDGALDTWPDRSDGTGESVGALAASEETTAAAEADWPDDELKDLDDISEEGRAIAKVSLTASDIGGPAVPTEGWPDDELEGLDASDDKHDKHEFSGAVSQLEVEEPTDNIPPVIPLGAAEEEPRGDVSAWPDDELEGLDDDEVAEQRPCEKIDDPAALEHAHGDSSAIDGSEQQLDVSDTAAVITTATACAEDTSDAAWPDDELEGLDEVSVEDHPTQPETHTTEHAPHEVVEMNSPVTNDVIEPAESAEGWPDDELEGLDASDDKHEFSGAVPQLQVDEPADTTQVVTAAATEEPSAGVSAWSDGELEGLDDDVEVNRVVANIEGKLQYVSTASAAAVDIVTAAEEVSESAGAWPEDELDGLDELLADEPQQNPALREFSASHDVVSACTDVVVDSTLAGCWPEDDLEDLDDDEDEERLNANQQQPASDDHIGHSGYVDQGADEELVLDAEEAVGVAPMATGNTFATAEGWPNEELGELELQDVDQLRDEGSAVAPGAAAGEHPTGDCESLPTTVYATGGAGWAEDALDGLDDLSETGEQRPSADVESAATTTAMAGEGQVQVAAESNSLTIKEGAFWRDDELAGLSGSDADIVQSTDDAHVVDEVVTCNSVEALDGFDDMEGKTSPNYSSPVQAAATDHEVLSDIVCAEEGSANGNESAEGSPDEELDDVEKSYDEANHPAVEFTEPASASMSPVFEEVGLDVNAADLNAPCNTQEGWRDEALESLDDVDAEPTLTEPPSSATATPIAATTVDAADVISSAGWLEDELRDRSDGGLQEEHSRLAEEALIPASAGSTAEIDFCNSQGAHMGAPKVQSRAEGWPSDELDGFKESDADDVDQAPIHQTERAASGDVVADGDTAAPVPDAGEGDGGGGWPDEDIEGLDDVDTDDRAQTFKEPRNVQATAAVAPQTSEDTEYCAPDSNSTGNGWAEEELDGLDDSDLDVVEEQERKGPQDTPIAGAAFAGAVEVLSEAAKGFVGDQLASNVTVTSAAEYATSMAGAIADTIAHVGWADADLEGLDDLEVEESPSSEEQELSISATATTVFEQQVVASTTGWLEDELDGLNDSIGDGDGPEDPPSTGDSNLGVISAAVAAAASFVTTEVLSSTNTVDPTADNISQEGWPEVDLEGLVDSDLDAEEQKPSAAAESTDNAGVLSDEDSDLTAIIESALEVAADVVGFAGTAPGASFNASRAAMHIAAFESAASKCNSSTHPAVSPAATATEGECAESLQAVHALCTQLAVSENDVALDCLLQFAASIPYVHFLRWLTEQMSTADLHLGDISALPVGEEDSAEALQEAVIWHVQALRFTANFSREGFDVEVDYPKEFLSRDPLR